jgi:hypothetical protein
MVHQLALIVGVTSTRSFHVNSQGRSTGFKRQMFCIVGAPLFA